MESGWRVVIKEKLVSVAERICASLLRKKDVGSSPTRNATDDYVEKSFKEVEEAAEEVQEQLIVRFEIYNSPSLPDICMVYRAKGWHLLEVLEQQYHYYITFYRYPHET